MTDLERYYWWRAHPRSYFVIVITQDGRQTLKLEPIPVEQWDKAYNPENIDAAIDRAAMEKNHD